MSTVSSVHKQTRQQLDELDALLQRMLLVPMNSSEEPIATRERMDPETFAPLPPNLQATSMKSMPPSRATTGEPILQAWRVEAPAPVNPPMAMPVEMPNVPNHSLTAPTPAPYPYSMVYGQPLPSEAPPATQPHATPISMSAPTPFGIPSPIWQQAPKGVVEPLPFTLWPIYGFNRLFDLLTFLLGPLGQWLRHPSGRNALGWLGILMILGAIGWGVADWYGLDWTR